MAGPNYDNRLELVITARQDTDAATRSFNQNLKSMEQQASETATRINREFANLTPSQDRALQAFINRSELAGKTGEAKIIAQANILKDKIGDSDKAVTDAIDAGTRAQVAAFRRRQAEVDRASRAAEQKREDATFFGSQRNAGLSFGAGSANYFKEIQAQEQLVKDLEARAAIAGKKTSERIAIESKSVLSGLAGNPDLLRQAEAHYKTLIDAARKAEAEAGGHGAGSQALRRGILGIKDLAEGSTRGAIIEATDIFVGTSGSGGILAPMLAQITEITGLSSLAIGAVAGLTAGFGALGIAGLISAHHLAETGQRIKDFSERTGIAPENVQHFQYAAKAEGADPALFERAFRGLAQATDEDSTSGARARKELKDLGVSSLYDDLGRIKPTEEIMMQLAEGISKLPPGLQQSAASMEIFKRAGSELLPVLLHLKENIAESRKIGGTFTASDLQMFDEWHKQIVRMDEEWDRFKARIEKPLAVTATLTLKLINAALSGGEEGKKAAEAYGTPYASVLDPTINAQLAERSLLANADYSEALGAASSFGDKGTFSANANALLYGTLSPGRPRPNPRLLAPPGSPESKSGEEILRDNRRELAASIDAMKAEARKDPRFALQEAEKELAALRFPDLNDPLTTPKTVNEYTAAMKKVESLRRRSSSNPDTDKNLQSVIAARQEGLNIDAQIAKQRVTDQAEILRAGMGSKSGLVSEQDINEELKLAQIAAHAETIAKVSERQFRIDPKTGRKIDESSDPTFKEFALIQEQEIEPKRVQEEYNKILTRMLVDSARFYRTRTDESMKHYEEEWQRRQAGELALQDQIVKTGNEISDRRTQFDIEANDRAKNIAIESLGAVNRQTLKDKLSFEDQKFAIEKEYADRGLALQLQRINTERARAIAGIQADARSKGIPDDDPLLNQRIGLENQKYDQETQALQSANSDRELSDAMKTAKAKEDLQIQSNRRIYDSLKQDAAGLFDQLVSHTKSWADFAKDLFKSAILTPVKDIFSSQVAGLFTGLITGNKVTFDPVGTGQGKLGGLEGALGRAGLGQPHFNVPHATPLVQSKLEQSNHLGDVSLVSGAVPVVLMNRSSSGSGSANTSSIALGALQSAAPPGWQVVPSRSTSQGYNVQSSWQPVMDDSGIASGFSNLIFSGAQNAQLQGFTNAYSDMLPKGIAQSTVSYGGVSPNGFPTMGEISALGTPSGIFSSASDNPWVLPTAPPYVDQSLSGVQLSDWANPNLGPEASIGTSGSGGGIFSQIGQMFGLGGGGNVQGTPPFLPGGASGQTGGSGGGGILGNILGGGKGGFLGGFKSMFGLDTAGTDMGNGVGIARTGLGGNLAAISKSGGFAMIGGGLALDGIRRGGIGGTIEAAGGGAMVGFKFGGPIGAVVGAAIGGGLALAKTFGLFGGDVKHTKDLVKQVYGMDINDATANSIIQIAKQAFGGQIDVAVRSPQVRDLLKLYSQATGQKKAEDMFVQDSIHGASLVEANGKLMQQAVYDNGNAYSYASQLGTYQGVQTSPLSTYAPNQGVFSGNVQILLNGDAASNALAGQVVKTATPGFIQAQSIAAGSSSIGRSAQTALTVQPSAISR
jgi:hypothetical protein